MQSPYSLGEETGDPVTWLPENTLHFLFAGTGETNGKLRNLCKKSMPDKAEEWRDPIADKTLDLL